jgi:large subunit ribosomal protein L3
MLTSIIGKKVGMTQVFDKDHNVVPVTVIDINNCYVTQLKTIEKEGYQAVQVGLLRKRYVNNQFSPLWLQDKKGYFSTVKELSLDDQGASSLKQGQRVTLDDAFIEVGAKVAVIGAAKGKGYQGVIKRWGFVGGPATHGSNFHRRPGSIGSLRTQGEVIKGKKLAGQDGGHQVTVKGLEVIALDKETGHLFVKGCVPGKKDSLVVIRKQG